MRIMQKELISLSDLTDISSAHLDLSTWV